MPEVFLFAVIARGQSFEERLTAYKAGYKMEDEREACRYRLQVFDAS